MVDFHFDAEAITPEANGLHEAPVGDLEPILTEAQMLAKLRGEVEACGFQKDWADAHGVSRQMVCETLRGGRRVRSLIAAAMGYRMIIAFVPLDEED